MGQGLHCKLEVDQERHERGEYTEAFEDNWKQEQKTMHELLCSFTNKIDNCNLRFHVREDFVC